MSYTVELTPIEGGHAVAVRFENGFEARTTVLADEAKTRWYVDEVFVPDLKRRYPELRGEGE